MKRLLIILLFAFSVNYLNAADKQAETYFLSGCAKFEHRDLKEAKSDLDMAVKLDPAYADAYAERARISRFNNDYDAALKDCKKALEINPKNIPALVTVKSIDKDSMLNCLNIPGKDWEKGMKDAVSIKPDNFFGYMMRALGKMRLKDYWGASWDLDTCLKMEPDKIYLREIKAYLRLEEKDYKGAINETDKVLEKDPGSPLAYLYRGDAEYGLHYYEGAKDDYTKAISRFENLALAYIGRAKARIKLAEDDKAVSDFNKAIELSPGLNYACLNKALYEYDMKKYDDASRDITAAMNLCPGNINLLKMRAACEYKSGRYDSVLADCSKIIELDSKDGEAFYCRHLAYLRRGKDKESSQDLETAKKLGNQKAIRALSAPQKNMDGDRLYKENVDVLRGG